MIERESRATRGHAQSLAAFLSGKAEFDALLVGVTMETTARAISATAWIPLR